jgi:hypothetical protein
VRDEAFSKLLTRISTIENQLKFEPSKEEEEFMKEVRQKEREKLKEKEKEKESESPKVSSPPAIAVKFSRFDD